MHGNAGSPVLFPLFLFFPFNKFLTGKPCSYSTSLAIFSTLKCYYICQWEWRSRNFHTFPWSETPYFLHWQLYTARLRGLIAQILSMPWHE